MKYSICTLVTRPQEYAEMRQSFEARGFAGPDCEYLQVDNSAGNTRTAYDGLNHLISQSRGEYLVLCHQDVLLHADGRAELDAALAALTAAAPAWGVCGNAGALADGRIALRMSDPHGADRSLGTLPAQVQSLDENFLVLRRAANLGFSHDLQGFHLYGTDICLVARVLGRTAHVIDFHLHHKSGGRLSPDFWVERERFVDKWCRLLPPQCVYTTCTQMYLSPHRWLRRWLAGPRAQARRWRRLRPATGRPA
ncbi:acyl esterase [Ideonella livida]|uniref:Acyl esterase n=1 Tax=Ideonella livida TaxID=2707176 RepID=A0A7C9PGH8_9BURK|nr:acyl esterase [Ideonella livida]NDY91168.1 acyl esterase [Ideonella livida]